MATTNLNIRIDANLKKQAEEIFNELGLDTPNAETLAAIEDVKLRRNLSGPFNSVKELMEDLNADD